MNFNKNVLIENFKNKNYSACIEMLTNKIIDKLVSDIQVHEPDYKYVNITNLRNTCLKHLDTSRKIMAIQLYDYLYDENYSEAFILDGLLNMYEVLYSESIYE